MNMIKNDLGRYEDFLQAPLDRGYRFVFFDEQDGPDRQLILRHDIDFDTSFALQMARIESEMGVKATYFFLMRSELYNLLSAPNIRNVTEIKELGHRISLHFDPVIYDDFQEGFRQEVALFQQQFDVEVQVVSIHRPNAFFQEYDAPIMGVEHTYQSKFFRKIKYFADSRGEWRYGHPFDSEAFGQGKTLQILIHPIWWMMGGESKHDKLRRYFLQRVDALKSEFNNNCIPFREIYESL